MKIIQNIHKNFRSHIIYEYSRILSASRRNKLKVVLAINRALLIMIFYDILLRSESAQKHLR